MLRNFKFIVTFVIFLMISNAYSSELKNIKIIGNERIPDETILMFANVKIGEEINNDLLNNILKNVYNSTFFKNVSVELNDEIITIKVDENPIIENINYQGIKSKKILQAIKFDLSLKPRSSYNDYLFEKDKNKILNTLKDLGYYFPKVETYVINLENNKVDLNFKINLGEKSKIKKISFIGNKIYKDKKLRSLIVSEEYKFWKIISGKKFLNENIIQLDERLLKNFYLNKGYYNVKVNSSFAKILKNNEFELIFNIQPNEKIYFNELSLSLPDDFEESDFSKLKIFFDNIKGEPYSINRVEDIIEEIEIITINEQNLSAKASIEEKINGNKLDLIFQIEDVEKYFVNRINIFGNNITQENVIRNQLEIDEGDPYNSILQNKTINNIKSLNFFRNVESEIVTNEQNKTKDINITVEERPTGQIFAGAGAGTNGATISLGVKENNYLGKGINLKAEGTVTTDSFKGQFSVRNPNYKNSDKSIFFNLQALEFDKLKNSGYKTNKTGFDIGTGFEIYQDLIFTLSNKSYYEKIETNSSASSRQKKQEGDYWDTFLGLNFDLDKRNQRFKTSKGYRSIYNTEIPLISDSNTFLNNYSYKYYTELYDENISSIGLYVSSANSLSGDDVKLSERLFLPYSRLRGFEKAKVGPKDGNDFIGGNYAASLNFSSTLPQVLPNLQELDISFFMDAANIWGVDYDSSIDDSNKIRSSAGIGIDWMTPIGPVNFIFAEAITKSDTDVEETFRFNIGTSF